jgi:Ser-tRNA(Ala) deacylase AlaX
MTTRLYLLDPKAYATDAALLRIGRDDRGEFAVFDRTVFHPQGGGQPSDVGRVVVGDASFAVTRAVADGDEVRHYGDLQPLGSLVGIDCRLEIEPASRTTNAVNHTAGHLVGTLGERTLPGARASKGYHFPDGPYVEFDGVREPLDARSAETRLAEELAAALGARLLVEARDWRADEIERAGGWLPPHLEGRDSVRAVRIAGLAPVPCGGTHVASLDEIACVEVVKVQRKGGALRIRYRAEPSKR